MGLFNILVDVAASTASFESGMKRVENQLDSLRGTIEKTFAFVGVGLGFKELIDDFDGFIDRAEQIEHASQKVGIAVDELSRLQFAASQTGVSTEELTGGIERFAKTVETATQGANLQQAAFSAMGISITDAAGKLRPIDTLLSETADKFASYADGLQKTALAQILFGRSGADLIPLLDKGSAGLAELGQRSDELGNTLNDNTAKAAELFNGKLGELKAAATGFWNLAAQQLLPTLTALVGQLIGGANAANKMNESVEPLVTGLKLIVDVGYSVYKTFADIGSAIGALAAIAVQAAQGHFRQAGDIWKQYNEDAKKSEADGNAFLEALWNNTGTVLTQVADKAADAGKKVAAPVVELMTLAQTLSSEYLELGSKIDEIGRTATTKTADEVDRNAQKLIEPFTRGPVAAKTMWDTIDQISQQGAQNIQQSFADFLFDPAAKGFSGLVIDFANALRKMVSEAAAAQLFKVLFGTDKEGNSGLGAYLGTALNALLGGRSGAPNGGDAPEPGSFGGALASGGPIESGKWYTAGEHGPEPIWGGGPGAFAMGYGSSGSAVINFAPVTNIDARGASTDLIARLPQIMKPIMKQNNDALENQIVTRLRRNAYS